MSILLTFAVLLISIATTAYSLVVWLRIRNLGSSPITTSKVAYDEATFGDILTWDKYCFYIHGKPVWLISGEFHYWRLPDRTRWRQVLMQYKAAGLNCIRIYFCWAYHSPDQGVYHFDGNRDLEYLMNLCEELELFVLAAPGPYICAETQAGGHPSWLVAKDVRLRHSVTTFFRTFDQEYTKYCIEWFSAILPILAKHQITVKPKGCVLALQIENEVFETMKGVSVGLSDDMRVLSKAARDLGMNVPFFTNDAWEEGSFVAHNEDHRVWGKKSFGIDLYGFDKYVVFCPTSNPLASVVGGDTDMSKWKDWDPKDVTSAFDKTEQTVRSFGGGAAQSPIFIPELQGGWFNHYTVSCTFDDVNNYYGEDFTKMVVETSLSQGCTAFNLYMFYGGTNWGTLGDPDVYTSYDYSACLREFGHLAGKTRLVRLTFAFAQSFSPEFLRTEANDNPVRSSYLIKSSISDFIAKQRITVGPNHIHFIFYRNFNKLKPLASTITLNRNHREPVQLHCRLGYKQSFIGLANYKTANGLLLSLSTLPILLRAKSPSGQEIWFIQCDDQKNGQLAFQGGLEIEDGTLEPVTVREDDVSLVSFKAHSGWCKIQQTGNPSSALYLIALTGTDLLSLHPVFREEHWSGKSSCYPVAVFWGAYQINFDVAKRELTIDHSQACKKIFAIASEDIGPLEGFSPSSNFVEFITEKPIKSEFVQPPAIPKLNFNETKRVDFQKLPWSPIELLPNSTRPKLSPIDLCFTSGHTIYKLCFNLSSVPATGAVLDINMRHRIAIILNNKSVGGHMTYALASLKPGSKNGPDIGNIAGWKKYTLPSEDLVVGKNEIFCVVESLGLNRAPGPIDDIRSPRGIMDARIKGVGSIDWSIAGVDVRKLNEVYNHSGIPDDEQEWIKIPGGTSKLAKGTVIPTWYRGNFEYQLPQNVKAPLRLSISGTNMAYVFVNGVFIARYYGRKQGPQNDFFVPPGLLKETNSLAIMTFGTGDDAELEMEFKLWKYNSDPTLISGSGNLDESGLPFILNSRMIKC